MRGADTFTESLFTMRHLDDFVPADHPLRVIRVMVNKALANMELNGVRLQLIYLHCTTRSASRGPSLVKMAHREQALGEGVGSAHGWLVCLVSGGLDCHGWAAVADCRWGVFQQPGRSGALSGYAALNRL